MITFIKYPSYNDVLSIFEVCHPSGSHRLYPRLEGVITSTKIKPNRLQYFCVILTAISSLKAVYLSKIKKLFYIEI